MRYVSDSMRKTEVPRFSGEAVPGYHTHAHFPDSQFCWPLVMHSGAGQETPFATGREPDYKRSVNCRSNSTVSGSSCRSNRARYPSTVNGGCWRLRRWV